MLQGKRPVSCGQGAGNCRQPGPAEMCLPPQLFLCSSRACLGKYEFLGYSGAKKTSFAPEREVGPGQDAGSWSPLLSSFIRGIGLRAQVEPFGQVPVSTNTFLIFSLHNGTLFWCFPYVCPEPVLAK